MKVLVVGCGAGTQITKEITNHLIHDDVVFVNSADEISIAEIDSFDKIIQPIKMNTNKLLNIPFTPRAKHCKKGHERPYKFHS